MLLAHGTTVIDGMTCLAGFMQFTAPNGWQTGSWHIVITIVITTSYLYVCVCILIYIYIYMSYTHIHTAYSTYCLISPSPPI